MRYAGWASFSPAACWGPAAKHRKPIVAEIAAAYVAVLARNTEATPGSVTSV